MKKKKNLTNFIYIVIFLAISIVPLLAFSDKQAAIGNETKAAKPKLSDGTELTANVDTYFAQNFGFRNRLVYVQNVLKQNVFRTSGQSEVIVGEDGWLFYSRALDDFLGTSVADETEVERMGAVVLMMQNYVESRGGEFIFFSAPNKMSVYGEYMPYYYIEDGGHGNYERLYSELVKAGVNTVQLKNTLSLKKADGVQLYHKLDSHWNNYGAAVAYETVANKLSEVYGDEFKGYTRYSTMPYSVKNNFSGDLQSMLLPGSDRKDEQLEFDVSENFEYTNRFRGVDDLVITTSNESKAVDKSVTLFRDSFGNALYWFFANDYTSLTAKREIPYNIYQAAEESELVAVELVERNLRNLLVYTPIVPSLNLGDGYFSGAVRGTADSDCTAEASVSVMTTTDGLLQVDGSCDALSGYAYIYLVVEGSGTYQVLPSEKGADFTLYLESDDADIFNVDFAGKVCSFVVKDETGYVRIPINVTLQD